MSYIFVLPVAVFLSINIELSWKSLLDTNLLSIIESRGLKTFNFFFLTKVGSP